MCKSHDYTTHKYKKGKTSDLCGIKSKMENKYDKDDSSLSAFGLVNLHLFLLVRFWLRLDLMYNFGE